MNDPVGDDLPRPTAGGLSKARIEALSDGIFAIVMTLMIFEIHAPDHVASEAALVAALSAMWPKVLSLFISALLLGVYWVAQHNQFHYIKRTDRTLLWLNIGFLMAVTFIPFSATLLGEYRHFQIAELTFGANLLVASGMLYSNWAYATAGNRLVDDLDPGFVAIVKRKIASGPLMYAAITLLSFVSRDLSFAGFMLAPLRFLVPDRVDRAWRMRHDHLPNPPADEAARRADGA